MKYTEVRTYAGIPPVAVFGSKTGTPIVLDTTDNVLYYLGPGNIVTALAGGGASVTHTGALTLNQLVVGNGAGDIKTLAAGTNAYVVTMVGGIAAWAPAAGGGTYVKGGYWRNGGVVLTVPAGDVVFTFPTTGTIRKATFIGVGGTGSAVADVWVTSSTVALPTVANTITASAKPTITAAVESIDSTLTGWTTAVTAGNTGIAHLVSVSGFTGLTLILELS